jgi:hypothetical protein
MDERIFVKYGMEAMPFEFNRKMNIVVFYSCKYQRDMLKSVRWDDKHCVTHDPLRMHDYIIALHDVFGLDDYLP